MGWGPGGGGGGLELVYYFYYEPKLRIKFFFKGGQRLGRRVGQGG